MKKVFCILLYIAVGINFSFTQTKYKTRFGLTNFNSKTHNKIYTIQVSNYQNLELIDLTNGSFKGRLTHSVFVTNRNGIIKDSVTQKIKISELIVKKLILNLKTNGYEKLKTCYKVENCITGLDGTTIVFRTREVRKLNSASYWELESDYYYKQNKVKLPDEVKKARELITIINKEFDLKLQFHNFLDRLPKGNYLFGTIVMNKK